MMSLGIKGNQLTPKSYKNQVIHNQRAALAEFSAGFSHKKVKKKKIPQKQLHINKGYFLGYFK